MKEDSYSPQELYQAERLEGYLNGLNNKETVPSDGAPADAQLFALARQFHSLRAQPTTLIPPLPRRRWSLKRILSWTIPVPIVASLAIWFVFWKTTPAQPIDVTAELAALEQSERDLLAAEQELDIALQEIDLLTATDYIDQL